MCIRDSSPTLPHRGREPKEGGNLQAVVAAVGDVLGRDQVERIERGRFGEGQRRHRPAIGHLRLWGDLPNRPMFINGDAVDVGRPGGVFVFDS